MILLIIFAFLAGVVTILSPCILPVLPIILSSSIGGKDIGKSRAFGIIAGFVVSFTLFTLFLSTLVRLLGISPDLLRIFSVVVIIAFGLSLLIPRLQVVFEQLFSKLTDIVPKAQTKTGFFAGLVIGISLGLLWTPCVGPILASVISLALLGTVTFDTFLITFAYSLGTALPMLLIIRGGQYTLQKVPWLVRKTATIQKIFGILMILTALAIATNLDRKLQTFILDTFPGYGVGLTKFEDVKSVRKELERLRGGELAEEDMGKPMFDLLKPKSIKAPELIPGGRWFNSDPLTLRQLQGKVVVIDFWTYSCINCQRTLPYLRKWWDTYKDKGLVIIGVHSPEFEFEKSEENVAQAINDFGLSYPIVQDNNFDTWRAYNNRYWPAKYFIDKEGFIRYWHFGEGAYDESERVVQELLKEAGASGVSSSVNNPSYQVYGKTPEIYLGYKRMDNFAGEKPIVRDELYSYSSPGKLPSNAFAFEGNWEIVEEYAKPQKGGALYLNFEAKEVYLVMRASEKSARMRVSIDTADDYFGEDVKDGVVTVETDRLYKLIKLETPGRHILKLEFLDQNAELYAFTFG